MSNSTPTPTREDRFTEFLPRLIGLAATILRDRARRHVSPDDVVQSALLSFFNKRPQHDRLDDDNLWFILSKGVRRHCQSWVRWDGRHPITELDFDVAEDGPSLKAVEEWVDLLETWMQLLTPEQRTIVEHCFQGYSSDEVADSIGSRKATVQRHLSAAKRVWRDILRRSEGAVGGES